MFHSQVALSAVRAAAPAAPAAPPAVPPAAPAAPAAPAVAGVGGVVMVVVDGGDAIWGELVDQFWTVCAEASKEKPWSLAWMSKPRNA